MTTFFTSQDLYATLGTYYQALVLDRTVGSRFVATGMCARMIHKDPYAVFTLDARRDPAMLTVGSAATYAVPDLEFEMAADDIHDFLLGRFNLSLALAGRRVRVAGSIEKLVELLEVFNRADGRYLSHLYKIGRRELE